MLKKNLLSNRRPIFKIENHSIKFIRNLNYLGFLIDEKLTFYDHFDNVREKIINFTLRYKSFSYYGKGIRKELLKTWYLTVIEKQIS